MSKSFLGGEEELDRLALTSDEKLAGLAVEHLAGETAVDVDLGAGVVRLGSGRAVSFDGLVIATGATPRRLASLGDLDGLMTLRYLEDAIALRSRLLVRGARLVVVGGGFLGMEVAATARRLGAEVTVVEPLDGPLRRVVGPEIGAAVAGLHRDHGVDLRFGVSVEEVLGSSRVEAARLSNGSSIGADIVLVAVGVVPETSWLARSGLPLDDGIVCGPTMVVAPGVVAAGDIARFPHPLAEGTVRLEHWTTSAEQGSHAAASLLAGEKAAPFVTVPYFWSDHYDVKIQAIGLPGPTDEVAVVAGSLEEHRFVACCGRRGRLVGVIGFSMPRELMRLRPMLTRETSFAEALAAARSNR